ncbi:hypothetical protein lerEdw1_010891 [Lerista edwardsae]|nr:hypothetical protein lerEdw1_010891 [Lerista edwardsae]
MPCLSQVALLVCLLQVVFRPPLDFYDVLIHLNPKQVPRHLEAVDRPVKSFSRGMLGEAAVVKTQFFPVVDYDPAQLYLRELRTNSASPWRPFTEIPCSVWLVCHPELCLPGQEPLQSSVTLPAHVKAGAEAISTESQ